MKNKIQEVPFSQMPQGYYLPWLIALMVFLLVSIMAGTLSISGGIQNTYGTFINKITIEIPALMDSKPEENKNVIYNHVKSIVEKHPGFQRIDAISSEYLQTLIRSWIGPIDSLSDLPMPYLFDVHFRDNTQIDIEKLTDELRQLSAGAHVESFNHWHKNMQVTSQTIQFFSYLVIFFIVLAMILMIILSTKSALVSYQPAINTLRLMGAQNSYIALRFQHQASKISLKGGLMGMGFAIPILAFFAWFSNYFSIPYIFRFSPSMEMIVAIISVPIVVALLNLIFTRLAVLQTLARLDR